MLPRHPSIFHDVHEAQTGAPPPLGPGTGQLYLVTRSLLMGGSTDLGPAMLLIKEKKSGLWGPPGGNTDKTDHSPLHAALREFGEETGADWRMLANAASDFQLRKIAQSGTGASQSWMMLVDTDAQATENALFGADRSQWKLWQRMNTLLSSETAGYAFVPLKALANADPKSGTFKLGQHTATLRYAKFTLPAVRRIMQLV